MFNIFKEISETNITLKPYAFGFFNFALRKRRFFSMNGSLSWTWGQLHEWIFHNQIATFPHYFFQEADHFFPQPLPLSPAPFFAALIENFKVSCVPIVCACSKFMLKYYYFTILIVEIGHMYLQISRYIYENISKKS